MKPGKSITVLLLLFFCFSFTLESRAQSKRKTPAPARPKSNVPPKKDSAAVPSNAVMQALLKASIADFIGAVESEDFTELHANASRDFQATFTPEQLKTIFQTFIDKKDMVLPSLKSVSRSTAKFTPAPYIRTEKGYEILVLNGAFPTRPYVVNFDNEYELEDGEWKLLKIKISM